jgi:hypothetical protein
MDKERFPYSELKLMHKINDERFEQIKANVRQSFRERILESQI